MPRKPNSHAARIEAARVRAGLTVTALAAAVGVSRWALQKLLAGKADRLPLDAARRFAAALGTTVDELFPPK